MSLGSWCHWDGSHDIHLMILNRKRLRRISMSGEPTLLAPICMNMVAPMDSAQRAMQNYFL